MEKSKANILGDLRAEYDHNMLEHVFYETPDFRSLLEDGEYQVVVGRRGVGKSALCYRLQKAWRNAPHSHLAELCPDENQIIGLRPHFEHLAIKPTYIHAASRTAWRYALIMEASALIWEHYKFRGADTTGVLKNHLGAWVNSGKDIAARLRQSLRKALNTQQGPEANVADLPARLEVDEVQAVLKSGLSQSKEQIILLIDRLDEGYEADTIGIGLLVGLIHAAIDLNTRFPEIRVILFLRDNIFRAISRIDPNYSRTVEGHVLRLHWDEYHLFNMITNRLRRAFGLVHESSIKVWNAVAADDLTGKDGFKKCLKHTLYRPRDLLSLLNQTLYEATRAGKTRPVYSDVELVAKDISRSRLEDLIKEYEAVFPGLESCLASFSGRRPLLSLTESEHLVSAIMEDGDQPQAVRQHFAILNQPSEIIRSLYSIGFLGVQDAKTKTFVFCHDGKSAPVAIAPQAQLFIHPCYWLALNCDYVEMTEDQAAEIHDEYDIEISSETPEIRNRRLGQQIIALNSIPAGIAGASEFEEWCVQALKIVFASSLRNIEIKPNGNGTQRRDIVATNHGSAPSWKRILDHYGSRQVIFEVKNFATPLGPDEYRQMLSYLSGEYGKLGFIINRSDEENLEKGSELDWVRELYANHKTIVIKLPAKSLARLLSKLRNPQKHDAADEWLDGLIDRYVRNFLNLGSTYSQKGKKKKS